MFEVGETSTKLVKTLRQAILSPLAMYELTEGNARDVHFAQTLPNEPLRLFFKHAQNVLFGSYTAELKGALTSSSFSSSSFTMQKFHETERVRKKFFEEFTTAYNALVPEAAAAVVASAAGDDPDDGAPPEPQKGKKGERQAKLAEFRAEAEIAVTAEINARMVILTQDGTHQEVTARLASTRLYQNLTESSVRFMAFYDVKNARLMERRPTETVVQREPLVDMAKSRPSVKSPMVS